MVWYGASDVGVPGVLHVAYSADKDRRASLTGRESASLRHDSLMTMISGGFKKLFQDDKEREKKAEAAPAADPAASPTRPVVHVRRAQISPLSVLHNLFTCH